MSEKLLTGPSPIPASIPDENQNSISIDISDFRMTPVITSMSVKNKKTTPMAAAVGLQPGKNSGANSQLEIQGISGNVVSSSAQLGNKYAIIKDLGEGTFGSVKLGKRIEGGQLVAIKILEKSRIKDKADIERVVREIKILKKIDHPAFVKLYEIIENYERIYLIMEYAEGGELFDYIVHRDKLTEREACRFYL